jgi:hypothetical protein
MEGECQAAFLIAKIPRDPPALVSAEDARGVQSLLKPFAILGP